MMNLFREAHKANEGSGAKRFCYLSVRWETYYDHSGGEDDKKVYLGTLEAPDMANHDLLVKFKPLFEELFLERLKAYGVFQGWDRWRISKLCYREVEPFGFPTTGSDLVYPFNYEGV